MNILFVSEYYPPKVMGGGEINCKLLVDALAKEKANVFVLTSIQEGLEKEQRDGEVVIFRRLTSGNDPQSFKENIVRSIIFPRSLRKEIRKICKEVSIDVIHLFGISIIVAPHLVSLKKKVFATVESYPALCPKGDRIYHGEKECEIVCSLREFLPCQKDSFEIGKMKNKWYLKYNPLFLLYVYTFYKKLRTSQRFCKPLAVSSYVNKLLLLHSYQGGVVENIIDTKIFTPAHENKDDKEKKKIQVLYLGSLTKYKGCHILLQAAKDLAIHLDIYGEGPIKEELQQKIKNLELDATIHPQVPYSQVASIIQKSDIVVFPSLWPEPFGRISLETMACAKPIIGSNIGAISEVIQSDAGLLVPPNDSLKLNEALLKLIENPNLRKSMGFAGRKFVEEHYTQKRIAQKLLKEYTNI